MGFQAIYGRVQLSVSTTSIFLKVPTFCMGIISTGSITRFTGKLPFISIFMYVDIKVSFLNSGNAFIYSIRDPVPVDMFEV